jgi:hypothetical protein
LAKKAARSRILCPRVVRTRSNECKSCAVTKCSTQSDAGTAGIGSECCKSASARRRKATARVWSACSQLERVRASAGTELTTEADRQSLKPLIAWQIAVALGTTKEATAREE